MSKVKLAGSSLPARNDNVLSITPANLNDVIYASIMVRRSDHGTITLKEYADGVIAGTYSTMSHAEFKDAFGSDRTELDAVAAFAQSYGIQVEDTHRSSGTVRLIGPISAFNSAFDITLNTVTTEDRTYRTYSGEVSVPEKLYDMIEHVVGLDTFAEMKHNAVIDAIGDNAKVSVAPNYSYLTPMQVANAYSMPSSTGSGQTVGIIELGGGYTQTDLTQTFITGGEPVPGAGGFYPGYGFTTVPNITNYSYQGANNAPLYSSGESVEVMLDIAVVGGVVPSAHIVMYWAPNTDSGFSGVFNAAINDTVNRPSVLSLSWGGQDWLYSDATIAVFESAFQSAVILGITITVATGDYGSEAIIDAETLTVQYPATSPYVLACGGTQLMLNSDDSIYSEITWNLETSATGGGVSGTGPSAVPPGYTKKHFAVPSWQSGCNSQLWQVYPGAVSALTGRGIPDVAGNASGVSGYQFWYSVPSGGGQTKSFLTAAGGTSAVSPLWAGFIARLNQLTGRRQGFINSWVYANRNAFYYIGDLGNNACTALETPGYRGYYAPSNQTWNACTGVGTPNGKTIFRFVNVGSIFPTLNTGTRPVSGSTYPRPVSGVRSS